VDELLGRILRDSRENDLVVVVSDHGAVASTDSERSLTLRVEPMLKNMGLKEAIEATNLGARTYLRMRPGYEGNPDRIRRLFETARLDRGSRRAFGSRVDEWGNVVVTVNPELAAHMDDTVLFQGGRCQVSEIVRGVDFDESGQVTETGTLVLAGKGVYPGRRFEGASILDLVPTLLVLNGFDLAADLAGDVITESLDEELEHRIPGVIATYETDRWDLVGEQN
jgi:arylsulfatase A-like enzyme